MLTCGEVLSQRVIEPVTCMTVKYQRTIRKIDGTNFFIKYAGIRSDNTVKIKTKIM